MINTCASEMSCNLVPLIIMNAKLGSLLSFLKLKLSFLLFPLDGGTTEAVYDAPIGCFHGWGCSCSPHQLVTILDDIVFL